MSPDFKKLLVPFLATALVAAPASASKQSDDSYLERLASAPIEATITQFDTETEITIDPLAVAANSAVDAALRSFSNVPYDWEKEAQCSTFSGQYLAALGYPVARLTTSPFRYEPNEGSPMPSSSTLMQLAKFNQLNDQFGGSYVQTVASHDLMNPVFDWNAVQVGSLLYLKQVGLSQYGLDQVQHVAVYTGLNSEGLPTFAEFAKGMSKGPRGNRSITQVVRGVNGDGIGGFEFVRSNGEPIETMIVDAVGLLLELSAAQSEENETRTAPTEVPTIPLNNLSQTSSLSFQMISYNDHENTNEQNPYRAINGLPEYMRVGGPILPNAEVFDVLGAAAVVTVNLVDGTTSIFERGPAQEWVQVPISRAEGENSEIWNAYAVIGRELKANPVLDTLFAQTSFAQTGDAYDGQHGVLWKQTGVPRTTYTPPMIAALKEFGRVDNFGQIGGWTDIAFLRQNFLDAEGQVVEHTSNNHYTIHEVPRAPDQDVRLREPDLIRANTAGHALEYPTLHRSSGCVNYDAATWSKIKSTVARYNGSTVLVVFTYPGIDQDLLLNADPTMSGDPFSNRSVTNAWDYGDIIDRRGYFTPVPVFPPTITTENQSA